MTAAATRRPATARKAQTLTAGQVVYLADRWHEGHTRPALVVQVLEDGRFHAVPLTHTHQGHFEIHCLGGGTFIGGIHFRTRRWTGAWHTMDVVRGTRRLPAQVAELALDEAARQFAATR